MAINRLNFRVWIKPDPEDDEPGKMVFPVWTGLPIDKNHTFEFEVNKEGDRSEYMCSDGVWMQFTGLKDRLSKEIYEGDILKGDAEKICVVKYDPGNFFIEYTNGVTNYIAKNPKWFEVIGNIYENGELLK